MVSLLDNLFQEFDSASIRYCHWKSNEHLDAALEGDTDLDLLVERRDCDRLDDIFHRLRFMRFRSEEYLQYTGIEDILGFDEPSGKLIHLHMHYALVVGKKFVKDRHLPWEEKLFESRIRDKDTGIWIIDPGIELLLLLLRYALKSSWSPRHLLRSGRLTGDDRREFDFLRQRVSPEKLVSGCRTVGLEKASALLTQYVSRPRGRRLFRTLERLTRIYGTLSSGIMTCLAYYRKKSRAARAYAKYHWLHRPFPYRRRLYTGGVIICFLGIDGSGKSTVIKEISRWLSVKLDPYHVYFGSGAGKSSLLRAPLAFLARRRSRNRGDVTGLSQQEHGKTLKTKRIRFSRLIWGMLLAREKRQKLLTAWQARNRGMIVLADRYPQTQFPGLCDGPLLAGERSSDRLARWELKRYQLADRLPPDLVIKLDVSIKTSLKRKQDTPRYILERKAEITSLLRFPPSTVVIEVSTDQSPTDTVREVKNAIWKHLLGKK